MEGELADLQSSQFDTVGDVMAFRAAQTLHSFTEMWYHMFLWSLFSSLFVHICAALVAFATLRKHKFGKFFPVLLVVMGVVSPATSGVMSSAAIAFVYRASSFQMSPIYAIFFGIGQTVLSGAYGFTRILATL